VKRKALPLKPIPSRPTLLQPPRAGSEQQGHRSGIELAAGVPEIIPKANGIVRNPGDPGARVDVVLVVARFGAEADSEVLKLDWAEVDA
jgi:hypothetical protein